MQLCRGEREREREKKIFSLCFMKQWAGNPETLAGVKFFKGKMVFLSFGEVSTI